MNENEFKPLTSSHGNISGEIENLRNTFLNAEYEYLIFLLRNERNRKLLMYINQNISSEGLYKLAKERIDQIEHGEVKEEDFETVEGQITLLLAAIQDKVLIKQLVLAIEKDEKEKRDISSYGRAR